MKSTRKFTIIIPTRERVDTLKSCIKTLLNIDYDNFQILISDNASADGTREYVESISDNRIKYINTGKRVSMSENWEFALNHIEDGWVTVIGDDDAVLSDALLKVNKIIEETNCLAIRSNGCSYSWPTLDSSDYGKLSCGTRSGYKVINSEKSLAAVLNGYLDYNKLPVLYNGGFVDSQLIKDAKSVSPVFFRSITPDVYSGIVFSLLTENYVYSYEPLAINGASHHSGGTALFEQAKRNRNYDPSKKFHDENTIEFHDNFPILENGKPVRSVLVLVYEAYLQASCFHHHKNISLHNELMLIYILRISKIHRSEVIDWALKFATLHGIDFDYALSQSRKFSLRTFCYKAFNKFDYLFFRKVFLGNSEQPICNVYDASVLAKKLLE